MKLITTKTLSTLILTLCLTSTANATLFTRLGGAAFYDDVLNITWLADANLIASETFGLFYNTELGDHPSTTFVETDNRILSTGRATWGGALHWIDAMNTANHLGYNDWRLPTMIDNGNDGCNHSFSGGTDCGSNVLRGPGSTPPVGNQSEMASLFYDTLGNLAYYDTAGNPNQPGYGLQNVTNNGNTFYNFLPDAYWSGLEYAPIATNAWSFFVRNNTGAGAQTLTSKNGGLFALVVRPGDVSAVPVPAAVWLMGSALFGLAGFRRKKAVPAHP